MKTKTVEGSNVAFGRHLFGLRISRGFFRLRDFAQIIGLSPFSLKKIEEGDFKFDLSIDFLWSIVEILKLSPTETHDLMVAGNRLSLRGFEQETILRRNFEYNEVWLHSGQVAYDDDMIEGVVAELGKGVSYKIFATEELTELLQITLSNRYPNIQHSLLKYSIIPNEQNTSEYILFFNSGHLAFGVDILRNNQYPYFVTCMDRQLLIRRSDIIYRIYNSQKQQA